MAKLIFRREALNRLKSPEQLDEAMTIISPKGWFALIGVAIFLGSLIFWAFTARIPVKVEAQGILYYSGRMTEIVTLKSGLIKNLFVRDGQVVRKGQLLAYIEIPELQETLQLAKQEFDEIRSIDAKYSKVDIAVEGKWHQYMDSEARSYTNTISRLKQRLRDAANAKQSLSPDQIESLKSALDKAQEHLDEIRAKKLEAEEDTLGRRSDRQLRIGQLTRRIEFLRKRVQLLTEIRTPYDGIVMEITSYPISKITEGDTLLILSPLGIPRRDLVGIAYVSATDSKKIRYKMDAEIMIATVRREQHGYMRGHVSHVSILPSTEDAVRDTLKVEGVANFINKNMKVAPVFVTITPKRNKKSVTGYQWSQGEPKHPIEPGTIFRAFITVDENRPIDYLVPIFERIL